MSVSFKCSAVDWNRWRHKLSREPDSHF